jgi:WW domain-containing oxidoreductase
MGATVIMACRNLDAAAKVADDIRARHPGADVVVGPRLDLADQASVRAFAAAYRASGRPLHCLVNNAGVAYHPEQWSTPEGVPAQVQVNYLGPYTLTRLLETELLRSAPARVVSVSSVTHRFAAMPAPAAFLSSWAPPGAQGGAYPMTKMANVLFAFELHRRLGGRGVQSCAVDPGGVASNIWQGKFAQPPLSWFVDHFYAPPSDGAAAVVHAASAAWEADAPAARRVNAAWNRRPGIPAARAAKGLTAAGPGAADPPAAPADPEDLRFFARGLFASPAVTSTRGAPTSGLLDGLRNAAWGLSCLLHSTADWPARRISGAGWLARTAPVPAAPQCYDPSLAAELWDLSADVAGLPRQPALLPGRSTSNSNPC